MLTFVTHVVMVLLCWAIAASALQSFGRWNLSGADVSLDHLPGLALWRISEGAEGGQSFLMILVVALAFYLPHMGPVQSAALLLIFGAFLLIFRVVFNALVASLFRRRDGFSVLFSVLLAIREALFSKANIAFTKVLSCSLGVFVWHPRIIQKTQQNLNKMELFT